MVLRGILKKELRHLALEQNSFRNSLGTIAFIRVGDVTGASCASTVWFDSRLRAADEDHLGEPSRVPIRVQVVINVTTVIGYNGLRVTKL